MLSVVCCPFNGLTLAYCPFNWLPVSPERTVPLTVLQVDESTQDVSVSQLSESHGADYLEDVAWSHHAPLYVCMCQYLSVQQWINEFVLFKSVWLCYCAAPGGWSVVYPGCDAS